MPWTPALQRLQQEDSTLEKIRGILLNSDQEVRGNAMFVMKEGIIYRQWSANSYEGEEVVEPHSSEILLPQNVSRCQRILPLVGRFPEGSDQKEHWESTTDITTYYRRDF